MPATRVTHRPGTSGLPGALVAEARSLAGLARRVAPTRRRAALLGVALLALVALSGVAGAAEPKPQTRSALEAWEPSAAPAVSTGPAASAAAAPVMPVASPARGTSGDAAPALPAGALGASPVFAGPDLFDLGLKVLLVVVLLVITLRVMRRVQGAGTGPGSGRLLDIVESRSIGPKSQLHLVAVGDRRLVVGQTPAGLVALGELDVAELPVTADILESLVLDESDEPASPLAAPAATRRPGGLGRAVAAAATIVGSSAASRAPDAGIVRADAGTSRRSGTTDRSTDRRGIDGPAVRPPRAEPGGVLAPEGADTVRPAMPATPTSATVPTSATAPTAAELAAAARRARQGAAAQALEPVRRLAVPSSRPVDARVVAYGIADVPAADDLDDLPVARPVRVERMTVDQRVERATARARAERSEIVARAERRVRLDQALAAADRAAALAERATVAAERAAAAADRAASAPAPAPASFPAFAPSMPVEPATTITPAELAARAARATRVGRDAARAALLAPRRAPAQAPVDPGAGALAPDESIVELARRLADQVARNRGAGRTPIAALDDEAGHPGTSAAGRGRVIPAPEMNGAAASRRGQTAMEAIAEALRAEAEADAAAVRTAGRPAGTTSGRPAPAADSAEADRAAARARLARRFEISA